MKKTIKILLGVVAFYIFAFVILLLLKWNIPGIENPAPDALHLIGFVALMPMIGAAGGKLADRKITYIKKDRLFKPAVVGMFIVTYLSLIPWILTFFIPDKIFLYIDWSIVLATSILSFIIFSIFLYVFINDEAN